MFCSNDARRVRLPPAPTPIPAFAPAPGRARHDGWTAERQRLFIAALASTGRVGRAAAEAGMSRKSAYRLRRRKGAESFAAAWDSIIAARPRGTSSAALVWRRLVKEAGGRSAVRIEDSTAAESEALRRAAARAAGRPAPRKVTMKSRRAFHELQAGRAMRPRPRKVTEATQIPVSGVDLVTFKKGEGPLVLLKGHTIFAAKE